MKPSDLSKEHPRSFATTFVLGITLLVALTFAGCETTTNSTAKKPAAGSANSEAKAKLAPESRIAVGTVIDRETALEKKDPLSSDRGKTAWKASNLSGAVGGGDAVRAGVLVGALAGQAMLDDLTDTEVTYTIRLRNGRTVRQNFIKDPKFRVGEDVVVRFDPKGNVKHVSVMREATPSVKPGKI